MAVVDKYSYYSGNIIVNITIESKKEEFVLIYNVSISQISPHTEVILDRIRDEFIQKVNLPLSEVADPQKREQVKDKFKKNIVYLIDKYLPGIEKETKEFFITYIMQKSFGLGTVEIIMSDSNLEEVVINNSQEPIWVYHHKHGWLKTNITLKNEEIIKHYASLIGRQVGRSITPLSPLLDAHLEKGDRVNATLSPISTIGNTITIRKFSSKPITITDFIKNKVISVAATALLWTAVQYEFSGLVSGGTASGKSSFLGALCAFIPPNQRVISVEQTKEIRLPKYLHWVPLVEREPNVEGKGGVSMLDLIINSLRMRPDRIIVGEIRTKEEAQTLFEAMHTGHSVYATLHANDTPETITRLITPPISVPVSSLPSVNFLVVMYRNRRSGRRSIFQISEILKEGTGNILLQLDLQQNKLLTKETSKRLMPELETQTGLTKQEVNQELQDKTQILKWLALKNISNVDDIGKIVATYYTNKENLLKFIRKNV